MQEMTGLLHQYGLLLVFANVFLTQAGAPVPAIPMLIVAGALVGQGELAVMPVMAVAIAASLLGDLPWYVAGRVTGYRVLRILCRVAIEPDSCVKQSENIFERWGAPSLLIAKFIPGFSIVAPPIAGAMHLEPVPFAIYAAIGAALWAGAAVVTGMVFHSQVDWLLTWLADIGWRAALVVGSVIVLYIAFKWFERYMLIRLLRMVRVTVDELHELMQQETEPVILDVRSAAARRLDPRHIPGAIPVDLNAFERHLAGVPTDREVVIYCT
jgi:membrane protein DedA with SNARE-associated domain